MLLQGLPAGMQGEGTTYFILDNDADGGSGGSGGSGSDDDDVNDDDDSPPWKEKCQGG